MRGSLAFLEMNPLTKAWHGQSLGARILSTDPLCFFLCWIYYPATGVSIGLDMYHPPLCNHPLCEPGISTAKPVPVLDRPTHQTNTPIDILGPGVSRTRIYLIRSIHSDSCVCFMCVKIKLWISRQIGWSIKGCLSTPHGPSHEDELVSEAVHCTWHSDRQHTAQYCLPRNCFIIEELPVKW